MARQDMDRDVTAHGLTVADEDGGVGLGGVLEAAEGRQEL